MVSGESFLQGKHGLTKRHKGCDISVNVEPKTKCEALFGPEKSEY